MPWSMAPPDVAAIATNVAANLYTKSDGAIQVLAVNTLGVLYILEKGDASTLWLTCGARQFTPLAREQTRSMYWTISSRQTGWTPLP